MNWRAYNMDWVVAMFPQFCHFCYWAKGDRQAYQDWLIMNTMGGEMNQ